MFGFVCYCVAVNSVGAVAACMCLVFIYVFVVGTWIGVVLRLTFVALCLVMLLRLLCCCCLTCCFPRVLIWLLCNAYCI